MSCVLSLSLSLSVYVYARARACICIYVCLLDYILYWLRVLHARRLIETRSYKRREAYALILGIMVTHQVHGAVQKNVGIINKRV
jgi:hypothetical protein